MGDRFFFLENTITLHEKYMIVSLLVPYVRDLREGLSHSLDGLKLPAPADGPVEIVARKTVR